MDKDLVQFKDMFIESIKENVQLLNNSLLKIEKDMTDKAAIEDAFRASHSIKGESASMDFSRLAYLAHAVEDVLYEVKKERMELTHEIADCLFGALDALGRSAAAIEKSGEDLDVSAEVERIKQITGVKTEGVGPTVHDAAPSPPKDQVEAPASAPVSPDSAEQAPPADSSEPAPEAAAPAAQRIRTVSVKVEQLDSLMNLFEELLVHRLTLGRLVQDLDNQALADYHHQVSKIIEALQFEIMKIRAVPLGIVFDHYPRAVRDLARKAEKEITLEITGADLELDRTIVERLDEPLTHLIRNAVSHGIAKSGAIRVSARREEDSAFVEVTDDGAGVNWSAVAQKAGVDSTDPESLKPLLFSGLSTAQTITEVSGRGVGLRAVKESIEELGGSIDVLSEPGKGGTKFIIKLPLSLAVMKALLVRSGKEQYAIPAGVVDRSVRVSVEQLATTAGQEAFVLDETEVPLIRLSQRFGAMSADKAAAESGDILVVVVMHGQERFGLVVDGVLEAADMIVRPVPEILQGNRIFGGTTILGDGRSALILNVGGLL